MNFISFGSGSTSGDGHGLQNRWAGREPSGWWVRFPYTSAFHLKLHETKHRQSKVLNLQPERKKLTESIWFWIYLFSTAGLISLVILQGKFDTRQDLEEINFRARMQTYEGSTATSLAAKTSSNEQIVTLTPLYILFGLIFAVSWIVLWKQRILSKPSRSQTERPFKS